jgi:hypothetical protein
MQTTPADDPGAPAPAPKRPRGRPPGTTKLAMDMRRAGADAHKPIDTTTSYLAVAPAAPRRGPGRPKGTSRAAMDARRLEAAANPPPPTTERRGGYRPGAGLKRKLLDTETPVQTAARHAQELRTMANRHHRELTRLNQRLRSGAT